MGCKTIFSVVLITRRLMVRPKGKTEWVEQVDAVAMALEQGVRLGLNALPMVELALNSAVHDATGMSPAFVVFGRSVRMPVDMLDGVCDVQAAQDTVDGFADIQARVHANLLKA